MLGAVRSTILGSGSLAVAVVAGAAIYGHSVTQRRPEAGTLLVQHASGKKMLVQPDCFSIEVDGNVSLEEFANAFLTSRVFKLERKLLPVRSTDEEASEFARGERQTFAEWRASDRHESEMLSVWGEPPQEHEDSGDPGVHGATWLGVAPAEGEDNPRTRLMLGSSIWGQANAFTMVILTLATPLHGIYSQVLLQSAADRLRERA